VEHWAHLTIILLAASLLLFGFSFHNETTSSINAPEAIYVLEKVEIGGMDQWVLVKGRDTANPVLLWLHGGPGASLMPASWYFDDELLNDFVVVHWDQIGSGKSNTWGFDYDQLNLERYVQDAQEVTNYIKEKLGKEKIYIIGYSWGSRIGIRLSARHPEDFYALISLGQVVSPMKDHVVTFNRVMAKAQEQDNERDITRLEMLGEPPYTEHKDYTILREMAQQYDGGTDFGYLKLAWLGLQSSEYRLRDYPLYIAGYLKGLNAMWEESIEFDAFAEVQTLKLPVYFLIGSEDLFTPVELVREYYEYLDAPMGKELIVFEHSAHAPFMSEPEKFREVLLRIKHETYK